MTKLKSVLAGAATVAALTIAVSGNALAHGSSHVSNNMNIGHVTESHRVADFDDHWRFHDRRFRFLRFGYADYGAGCFYKWTWTGRVRICPDLYY
jgi:hypothetical protein